MELSADRRRNLRCLAEMMIPASAEFGVPSAGEEAIFADIMRSFGRDAEHVLVVLRSLEGFADMAAPQREVAAARLRETGGTALVQVSRIILQCYYRDDRVMRSLGMETRPPFPRGFDLEQGDWSLLDPVRARPKLYREVP